MRYVLRLGLAMVLAGIPVFAVLIARAADDDYPYLVGRGMADVTGPPVGVQMWGFVREDQITEGIHFRLFSRAFVVAERDGGNRIAFASVDLGSITHAIHLEVVERLQERYGDAYTEANVILSATHTHAGPGGYWHYGADSPLGGAFYKEHFDLIVGGIVASIAAAHADLQPGSLTVATGHVEGAGANRSMTAYLANPEAERARYAGPTDTLMTLLRFEDASGPIGAVNWFASHPTAMNYYNKLISGDHKGHASARLEATQSGGFVAAFAQSNAGDISPNLNLDNTGPGDTDRETTRIIAERQLAVAQALLEAPGEPITGPIAVRHRYVNMKYLAVDGVFTGTGPQTTCPSAYGYAFAAGSTEDGGGHPLFREGMKTRNAMIDGVVAEQFALPEPSDRCRECHAEKAILFAPGDVTPPQQAQVVPMTLARIGQIALVAVPAEFTTMAGRRLRETVADALGDTVDQVVLVGYANGYNGYTTTREEYATQQYEGGHTLYGPWTLAAYRQEFTRMARSLVEDTPLDTGDPPVDMRGHVTSTDLSAPEDELPDGAAFGQPLEKPKRRYARGDVVEAVFWSGDPRNALRTEPPYVLVQRESADGSWVTVATDNDWNTTSRWLPDEDLNGALHFRAAWTIPPEADAGTYRIVHTGNYLRNETVEDFEGVSRTFRVE